jgi:alkaline phosphatase D
MSGDPTWNGSVIWTRVAPPAQRRRVPVVWIVTEDESLHRVVRGGIAFASSEHDYTVKIRVRGLRPDRWYGYAFYSGGALSRAGRLRTAPRPGSRPDRLRYAFASCQQRTASYYVAHRAIAEEGVDFLMHLGDYVYVSDDGTITLDDYRGVYRRFHDNPLLQDMQARVPLIPVWDDGEFYNGVDRTGPPERLAAARRAWFEYMPVEPGPQDRLYRRLRWGRLADILMLDLRSYRDPEVPANSSFAGFLDAQDSRFPPSDQMFAPGRTTLGAEQKRWLERQLARSRADWRMIGSSYNVNPWKLTDFDTPEARAANPDLPKHAGLYASNEAWDDYAVEREELLQYLLDRRIDNVVFTSGHTHFYIASELQPDFDDPSSPVAAYDFVTGSLTADPDPRTLAPEALLRVAEQLVVSQNVPYMKNLNLLDQGYAVVDLTPEECLVRFRVIDTYDPNARARTASLFRVGSGSQTMEVLPVPEEEA